MKWVLFGRLITSISSIVSNVVIIRVLGVNDVSAYFLFLSFVSLVGVFLLFGLNKLNVIVAASVEAHKLVAYIFNSVLVLFVIYFVFIFFWIGVGKDIVGAALFSDVPPYYLECIVIIFSLQIYFSELFRGMDRIRDSVLVANIGVAGSGGYGCIAGPLFMVFVLGCFYCFKKLTLDMVYSSILLANFIALVFAFFVVFRVWGRAIYKTSLYNFNCCLKLVGESVPMLPAYLIALLPTQIELWALNYLADSSDVADYGAVLRVIFFQNIPMLILWPIIQKKIVKGHMSQSDSPLKIVVGRWVLAVTSVNLVLLFLFFLGGGMFLSILYGEELVRAYYVLIIKSFHVCFLSVESLFVLILSLSGGHRFLAKFGIIILVFQMFASYALFQVFDVLGVFVASILASTLGIIVYARSFLNSVGRKGCPKVLL